MNEFACLPIRPNIFKWQDIAIYLFYMEKRGNFIYRNLGYCNRGYDSYAIISLGVVAGYL